MPTNIDQLKAVDASPLPARHRVIVKCPIKQKAFYQACQQSFSGAYSGQSLQSRLQCAEGISTIYISSVTDYLHMKVLE